MGAGGVSEKTVVLCWLWRQEGGRTTYAAHHVNVWADMVRRHLSVPHDLACVTDMPAGIDRRVRIIPPPGDFENVTIPTWSRGRPQCHRRLAIFRPDAAQVFGATRIFQTDLDIVVCDSLDPLVSGKDDIRICAGTAGGRPYNGSLVLLRCGSRPRVYTEFTEKRAIAAGKNHVGSDQSYLLYALGPKERTFRAEDGVVSWMQRHQAKHPRLITYPGPTKPDALLNIGEPFVAQHYRREPRGRALVLGYGPMLWEEVAAALDRPHEFDTVIASPEAAAHWPAQVDMVADDDDHAERLAAMHGLEPVWCGRSEGGAYAVAA
jgi:hypothetical protein